MPFLPFTFGGDWNSSKRKPGVGQGKGRGVTKPRLRNRRKK